VNRLAALLGADRPVLLDGGMGTLLQDRGLEDGAPGELWNLENPDAVRAAHAAYAEAGARLLTTTPSAALGRGWTCTGSATASAR
jgi:methionine synthase I (cobalamin-dependent)